MTTYERHVSQKTQDLVSLCAGGFASALQRCVAFLHGGFAPKARYFLLKGASGLEQSIGQVGDRLELVEDCRPLLRTVSGKEMLRLPSNAAKMKAASYITCDKHLQSIIYKIFL